MLVMIYSLATVANTGTEMSISRIIADKKHAECRTRIATPSETPPTRTRHAHRLHGRTALAVVYSIRTSNELIQHSPAQFTVAQRISVCRYLTCTLPVPYLYLTLPVPYLTCTLPYLYLTLPYLTLPYLTCTLPYLYDVGINPETSSVK